MEEVQNTSTIKQFSKTCFKKYRARWFLNKQVALVLLWIFLVWIYDGTVYISSGLDLAASLSSQHGFYTQIVKDFYLMVLRLVSIPLSGFFTAWLAGWKYRIPGMIFTGLVIAGIGTLMEGVLEVVRTATGTDFNDRGMHISDYTSVMVKDLGSGAALVHLFQLAMEQIPEASASQMSSLINWMVFTAVMGSWSSTLILNTLTCSFLLSKNPSSYDAVGSLLFPVIIALILSTYSLQKRNLMDYSPSSNVINNIYKVVKYAVQHKHPQRRSAMTYWEERIPSRLALGKAKYGGPFTSEQVEDVRTFFRIGALYLAVILYLTTLYLNEFSLYYMDHKTDWNKTFSLTYPEINCHTYVIWFHFAGYNYWWLIVSIPIYEFFLVPLLGYKMPRMLSKIAFSTLLALLLSIVLTIFIIMDSYSNKSYTVSLFGLSLPMGVARAIFYTAGLEFLCAQSPYAMRNFFISLGICVGRMCPILSTAIFSLWAKYCNNHVSCPIIYSASTLALYVIGLVVFWITIKNYRQRSRGHEDEHQQKWVEDAYNKYVEQQLISED